MLMVWVNSVKFMETTLHVNENKAYKTRRTVLHEKKNKTESPSLIVLVWNPRVVYRCGFNIYMPAFIIWDWFGKCIEGFPWQAYEVP